MEDPNDRESEIKHCKITHKIRETNGTDPKTSYKFATTNPFGPFAKESTVMKITEEELSETRNFITKTKK